MAALFDDCEVSEQRTNPWLGLRGEAGAGGRWDARLEGRDFIQQRGKGQRNVVEIEN